MSTNPSSDNSIGSNASMNIRRFVAENSRAALRQVRDTLGGDAIILANRSIEGGVEVLAAAPEAVDALTRRMAETAPASSQSAYASRRGSFLLMRPRPPKPVVPSSPVRV